jgi:hypothetical protein
MSASGAASGSLAQGRVVGVRVTGIGPAFVRRARLFDHALCLDHRAVRHRLWCRKLRRDRAALRVLRDCTAHWAFQFCDRSFEEPYNIRLHQTAAPMGLGMTTIKKIGVAVLVIGSVVGCLLLWLFWYYRPTIEYAY